MKNGEYVWGLKYYFIFVFVLGEDIVQWVVIFGISLDVEFVLKLCDFFC